MNTLHFFLAFSFFSSFPIWTRSFFLANDPISGRIHFSFHYNKLLKHQKRHETHLHYSKDENQDAEFWRRMALVRTLQSTYYSSPSEDVNATTESKTKLDLATGTIQKLPIWRVGWTELPGRSNVLFINEPSYTHMFEQIMRTTPRPWYFGHLYLEGGSTSLQKARAASAYTSETKNEENDLYRLKGWKDEIARCEAFSKIENDGTDLNSTATLDSVENISIIDDEIKQSSNDKNGNTSTRNKSSVVGTLMRIVDLRRMKDGRILLLVQALERFAVSYVYQEFPYAIADIQLIPDLEETSSLWSSLVSKNGNLTLPKTEALPETTPRVNFIDKESTFIYQTTEDQTSMIRGKTISEAFEHYHSYEYDSSIQLPVKDGADVSVSDVFGPYLRKVMPFIPYSSKSFSPPKPVKMNEIHFELFDPSPSIKSFNATLERQMIEGGILQDPPEHPEMHRNVNLSADELEELLWIYIDEFVRMRYGQSTLSHRTRNATKTGFKKPMNNNATFNLPINPNLLALLPQNKHWPHHFILEDIAKDLAANPENYEDQSSFVRVSQTYPAHRRQRRLSFTASALLERMPMGGGSVIRQILLEIPSTQARLCVVVERFEFMNAQLIGNMGEFM